MNEGAIELNSWEAIIVNFFEKKISESSLYKARQYIEDKQKEIAKEKDQKKKTKLIERRDEKNKELIELRKTVAKKEIPAWLDKISETKIAEGKRIIKATHVLRFTHNSASPEGLMLGKKDDNHSFITTDAIKSRLAYDLAHNNGKLITISRFLSLCLEEDMIFDCIIKEEFDFLDAFSRGAEQRKKWISGISKLIEKREIKTADKAKQVFFPISRQLHNYHLLTPLFASSIAEKIYQKQIDIKFGAGKEVLKNAKSDNELIFYSTNEIENFPSLALQSFGGAQPQNVSRANKDRGGISYLFSAQPPIWQSQLKPPIYQESFFYAVPTNRALQEPITYLRDFLLRFDQIGLSIKDPKKMKWVEKWVEQIIDEIFAYSASIQNLMHGWSESNDMKLKKEHQYFLDPFRMDSAFQTARRADLWQPIICEDFAKWLNHKLEGKDRLFTPQSEHKILWMQLMKDPLREFNDLIDMEEQNKVGAPQ